MSEQQERYITTPTEQTLTADALRIACRMLSDAILEAAHNLEQNYAHHDGYPVGLSQEPNGVLQARQRQILLAHAGYLVIAKMYCEANGTVYREKDFAVWELKKMEGTG